MHLHHHYKRRIPKLKITKKIYVKNISEACNFIFLFRIRRGVRKKASSFFLMKNFNKSEGHLYKNIFYAFGT